MKSALPLTLLTAVLLAACSTTSNKRDLYSPVEAHGPWTQKKRGMTLAGRYDHRSRTHTYVVKRVGPRPPANAPALPPPPAPPTPALPAQ